MAEETAKEKRERISNQEINEMIDKAEELIMKMQTGFIGSVTATVKSQARKDTLSRLFKTGIRAMGIIQTMDHARRSSGPKDLMYVLSQAVERMAASTEVMTLMEEFMELLEMKRAQKRMNQKFDTKMAN